MNFAKQPLTLDELCSAEPRSNSPSPAGAAALQNTPQKASPLAQQTVCLQAGTKLASKGNCSTKISGSLKVQFPVGAKQAHGTP